MNVKTGLELFKSIWLIEPESFLGYLQMWEHYMQHPEGRLFRSQENEEYKALDKSIFLAGDGSIQYAPVDLWSREAVDFKGFDGAETVVIMVEGPLMKNDYCGYAGTGTLSKFFKMAEQTESVKTIILIYTTPGGTVDGTANFADMIATSQKQVKSVIAGQCCSAGYWLASQGDEIIATAATDIIGSIGTMCSWYDRTKYMEENGIILREFFATRSQDKSKAYREANKGNAKLLVQSMLDPLNDEFIASVLSGREGKISSENDEVLTGKTFTAKNAKANGLIDDIMPLEKILEQSAPKQKKQQSSFSMKNFKLVLAAAAIAAVYEEGKFFSLSEEQLEKVEAALQAHEDAAGTATTEHTRISAELATANTNLSTANTALGNANTTIKTLQDEIVTLKAADGTTPAAVVKETDETSKVLPKTSVDLWRENLNK